MPRHNPRKSKPPRARVEYDLVEEYELEEPRLRGRRNDALDCRFPKFHREFSESPGWRYAIEIATWIGLLSFVAFIGVAIGFTVKFLVEGSKLGPDTASSDFALYKNSRFKECQTKTPPDAATCQDVQANLLSLRSSNWQEFTDHGISVVISPYIVSENRTSEPDGHPVTYDWCQAVSCLGDSFKIVSSTPRNSAFLATPLSLWCAVAITLATTLWEFRQRNGARVLQLSKKNKVGKACKGLGEVSWYYWIIHGYSLSSFVWWWVSFASFATSPAYMAAPSSLGWIVPWKYAILIKYHPYSCAFTNRRWPRRLSWGFNTLAFLQWVATVYVLHVNYPNIAQSYLPFQSYDCATSFLAEAPGNSPCSTEQLCSNPWFFTHPGFTYRNEWLGSDSVVLVYFSIFTLAAVVPSLIAGLGLLFEVVGGRRLSLALIKEVQKEAKINPTVTLAIAAWAGGIVFGSAFTATVIRRSVQGQEAPLTLYPACNAVHVALSPWRFYLDVDSYQKILRIAKLWFNS